MASLQPVLQGHTVVSTDSLIATVLPKLGSAPDLGLLRMTGNILAEMHHREDVPSLADFVKKALMGGWVTPAHRKLFTYGDDTAALRAVAHDTAWHMGQQVQGSLSDAFPEETSQRVRHAIAPNSMCRVDLVPLFKAGLEIGICPEAELAGLIGNAPGTESRLHEWWNTCFLQRVQSASPLAHKHPCMIATELISTRDRLDDPATPADVVFRWGLEQEMTAAVLNLPVDDTPESVGLRDLVLLLSGATQAVAIDFLAPYEAMTHGMGFMWEDGINSVAAALGGKPPTVDRVFDLVMRDLPESETEGEMRDLGTIMEHTGFESLMMHIDAHAGREDEEDPVRNWCAGMANVLASQAYMRNPLQDIGGLKDDEGQVLPSAVIEHMQGRIDAELPAIRVSHPAVAETLATWANWLAAHVAAGGEAAEWEVLADQDYEDAIPIPNLIQACPGLHLEAELQYGEQIHQELMNGAGSMASTFLSQDNLGKLKQLVSAASCANALIHILNELAEQMGGDVYAIHSVL